MSRFTSTILLSIVLAGCQSIDKSNVVIKNASESKQLDIICKARPIAVAVFDVMRSQAEISDNTVAHVYQASSGIKTICENRPKNLTQALLTATKLYSDILNSQSGVATAVAAALAEK